MTEASLYQRLQLHPNASQYEIESAYQRLQAADPNVPFEIRQAYTVLRDPASRSAYDAMRMEPVEDPPLRPLLRFYGLASGLVGLMQGFRSQQIPVNWIIALLCAIAVAAFSIGVLIPQLAEPTPTARSILEIATTTGGPRYVTVTGEVYSEPFYRETNNSVDKYIYAMTDGDAFLMVVNYTPTKGNVAVTGRLVKMDRLLKKLVDADAAEADVPVENLYYLDATPRHWETSTVLVIVAVLLGVIALMITPSLRGFTAFAAAEPTLMPAPLALLPLPVRATGRYVSDEGDYSFQIGAPSVLMATDKESMPYVVQARLTAYGEPYDIPLLRGVKVEWGYDYSFGRAQPAILIQGRGPKALLTLPDAATAAGLASLLQRSLA